MTRWEYFTAPILSHVAQQILNNFGADGWELVQLVPGPETARTDDGLPAAVSYVGFFKRPVRP
ncbi:DUF4177 domain-containing protein [uncultured Propionibacterium sp.]|uniref:DUF4177 domain-containing protein n=1 Tax=uncultured Propionibacterium sp. TaxID=218066 RepID=UPI00292DEA57|nr:DUF4177 domain-containing protein [uncultured Propionibacterium sp.]